MLGGGLINYKKNLMLRKHMDELTYSDLQIVNMTSGWYFNIADVTLKVVYTPNDRLF